MLIALPSLLNSTTPYLCGSWTSNAKIVIDSGAAKALSSGKSLLPAGIIKVVEKFNKGENVLIVDENEKNLARGLSSFSSDEINKVKGLQSNQIKDVLGYSSKSEIVHKDDMVKL